MAEIVQIKHCSRCGGTLPAKDKYCVYCGQDVQGVEIEEITIYPKPSRQTTE